MGHPDILFLVLDSVRPDRVSCYGHWRLTTPTLDELASRATIFEHAFAPAPWTLPSHASMFTGLAPSEHGMTNWFADEPIKLPDELSTVAETLSDRGYRTAGFSNNPWVGSLTDLNRGFDEFVEWDLEISKTAEPTVHGRAGRWYSKGHSLLGIANRQPLFLIKRRFFTTQLVDRAISWLEHAAEEDAPTFTFLNLMEAHSPYVPPKSAFRSLNLPVPGILEPRLLNTRLLAYIMGHGELSEEQRTRILEYYDASLRFQDQQVEKLLRALQADGRFDDTLIVICSDHGKNLDDIGRDTEPSHYLRWPNTNVPLIVKLPGQSAGRMVETPVELTGLAEMFVGSQPTTESALETDGVALIEDSLPHTGRAATETTLWRILADGEYRYIQSDDGREYLLRDDTRVDDSPALMEWLRQAMDDRIDSLKSRHAVLNQTEGIDSTVERQLGDLGYL